MGLATGKKHFFEGQRRSFKKNQQFCNQESQPLFCPKGKLRTLSAFPPLRNNCHPYFSRITMKIHFNRTKVIATVGPASNSKEMLLELVKAGADVFRLNFSHGSHEDHLKVIQYVRELNREHNLNIGLLQDLQGPKIRTREVENNGVNLAPGSRLVLTNEKLVGNSERISTTYLEMADDVQPGDRILLDDGKLELKVTEKQGRDVITEVVYGGVLKSKKGINLPNTAVSIPALTEKDREDLLFGLEHNVEWIALSFVRKAD